jgi:small conductance mechanosensitive channel
LASLWQEAKRPETLGRWAEILGKIFIVLALGFTAEWAARKALARPRRAVEHRDSQGLLLIRSLNLIMRTLLDVLPILAFAAATYLVLPLTDPRPETRLVALAIINANVLTRVTLAASRIVLAPNAARLRFFSIGDETVTYLYIWVRRFVSFAVYGYFTAEAALLLGLAQGAYQALLKILGLVLAVMGIILILQNKGLVTAWLKRSSRHQENTAGDGAPSTPTQTFRGRVADVWHAVAIMLIVFLYGAWALEIPGGFQFLARALALSALVLVIATAIARVIDILVDRGFRLNTELKARFPELEARLNRYLPMLRGIFKGVVAVMAGLVVLDLWGLGTLNWLGSEAGSTVISHLVTTVVIILAALVIWEILSLLIERLLRKQAKDEDGRQSARLLTLLPLLRNVVRVTLIVMVSLIVLSELGLDIGPLLAGAGVVGLAVGFGAQTLVKDVITGTFILVENSLAAGDWVDLGTHSGTVEAMTIRTVTLRDREGTIHVVPFGEVASVINYNRGYGYAVIDVGVAYREDVDEVIKVLEEVGEDMRADDSFGPSILDPLEVFGLNNLGESSVDIRVRLKTKAMMQWGVRREFLRRTKRIFDQRGIEIPFPHRTIYFGVDKEGHAPPAHVRQDDPSAATADASRTEQDETL